ncbi:PREDICTED: uncharacterized protein LOC104808826 [Tarenaya hassleriana]|uniref:uncharacterized protein LOC104808826 n=1 Tax=Tarenaya hassleriana TaxID=28532 RepID=UPI0008FCE7B0|nr:PREDICTED: uncharacterized protein LOC104808826 [Tarenaya hassleriana]
MGFAQSSEMGTERREKGKGVVTVDESPNSDDDLLDQYEIVDFMFLVEQETEGAQVQNGTPNVNSEAGVRSEGSSEKEGEGGAGSSSKIRPCLFITADQRPRLRWTVELHTSFVNAVMKLGGPNRATPKTIMEIMEVEGLALHHVKSHLQKFRLGKCIVKEWPEQPKKRSRAIRRAARAACASTSAPRPQVDILPKIAPRPPLTPTDIQGSLYMKLEADMHLKRCLEVQRMQMESSNQQMEEQRQHSIETASSSQFHDYNSHYNPTTFSAPPTQELDQEPSCYNMMSDSYGFPQHVMDHPFPIPEPQPMMDHHQHDQLQHHQLLQHDNGYSIHDPWYNVSAPLPTPAGPFDHGFPPTMANPCPIYESPHLMYGQTQETAPPGLTLQQDMADLYHPSYDPYPMYDRTTVTAPQLQPWFSNGFSVQDPSPSHLYGLPPHNMADPCPGPTRSATGQVPPQFNTSGSIQDHAPLQISGLTPRAMPEPSYPTYGPCPMTGLTTPTPTTGQIMQPQFNNSYPMQEPLTVTNPRPVYGQRSYPPYNTLEMVKIQLEAEAAAAAARRSEGTSRTPPQEIMAEPSGPTSVAAVPTLTENMADHVVDEYIDWDKVGEVNEVEFDPVEFLISFGFGS